MQALNAAAQPFSPVKEACYLGMESSPLVPLPDVAAQPYVPAPATVVVREAAAHPVMPVGPT